LDRSKLGAGSDDPHRAIKAVRAVVWGKMDVAQMMAHCGAALEMASGIFVAKRTLLGRIVGPRVRHALTDDSPFPRNSPTAKKLKVSSGDFTQEHERLKQCVRQFHEGGDPNVRDTLTATRLSNGARACTNT